MRNFPNVDMYFIMNLALDLSWFDKSGVDCCFSDSTTEAHFFDTCSNGVNLAIDNVNFYKPQRHDIREGGGLSQAIQYHDAHRLHAVEGGIVPGFDGAERIRVRPGSTPSGPPRCWSLPRGNRK